MFRSDECDRVVRTQLSTSDQIRIGFRTRGLICVVQTVLENSATFNRNCCSVHRQLMRLFLCVLSFSFALIRFVLYLNIRSYSFDNCVSSNNW